MTHKTLERARKVKTQYNSKLNRFVIVKECFRQVTCHLIIMLYSYEKEIQPRYSL